jgi:hypothetical protein
MKTWDELKKQGSAHYKTGSVEPVDLYLAAGAFRPFALCSIMKYAYRNLDGAPDAGPVSNKDMRKIIDYAEKLIAGCGDGKEA